jgi:hypothetical protein
MFRQEVQSKDMDDLRGEYFRKTIERAFAKAKRAGGALICYVGGAHAFLNAFGPGDYTVAKTTEARYFNTQYPASKGRVASILIERIGEWNEPNPGTLEAAAIALMGDKDRVFINLRDRSWTAMSNLLRGLKINDAGLSSQIWNEIQWRGPARAFHTESRSFPRLN